MKPCEGPLYIDCGAPQFVRRLPPLLYYYCRVSLSADEHVADKGRCVLMIVGKDVMADQ
jgi:hypothetical protein